MASLLLSRSVRHNEAERQSTHLGDYLLRLLHSFVGDERIKEFSRHANDIANIKSAQTFIGELRSRQIS